MGHGELFILGWPVLYRDLFVISSIVGITKSKCEGHFELIAVNGFFAKCSVGGSANERL